MKSLNFSISIVCHKLLKYKPCYHLSSKMFDIVTLKLLPTSFSEKIQGEKVKVWYSENEAKQNWYRLPTSSIIKILENFKTTTKKKWQAFIDFFVHLSRKVYTSISILRKMFPFLIAWLFGDGYKWRVDCLQMFKRISHVSHIFEKF